MDFTRFLVPILFCEVERKHHVIRVFGIVDFLMPKTLIVLPLTYYFIVFLLDLAPSLKYLGGPGLLHGQI